MYFSNSYFNNHPQTSSLFLVVKIFISKFFDNFSRNSLAPILGGGIISELKAPLYSFKTPSKSMRSVFYALSPVLIPELLTI